MTVLVTRPAQEAQRWVQQLRAAGIAAEALPLLAIGPAADPTALAAARATLGRYAAVMFVSPNAVQGFFGPGMAWPAAGPRAWAPGPGTRDALREQGVPAAAIAAPDDDADQFDSEHLWAVVSGQVAAGDRLLLVRGADAQGRSQGREWLAGQLAAAGVQVDVVSAYSRAVPAWTPREQALATEAARTGALWLFSSSEAAGNLRQLLPDADWSRSRALATHPRIAQAVRALGFGEVRECRPGFMDVLASIESCPMSSPPPTPSPEFDPALPVTTTAQPGAAPEGARVTVSRATLLVLVLLAGGALLWSAMLWQRLGTIQEQLARQSADSGANAIEARALAKQAHEIARDATARQAVLESRLTEVALQRSQLEELMQSLSRSQDENLVVDIESALRLAQQQTQLTGSAEPLLAALREAQLRLERAAQPRLARLQAAVARDMARIRAASVTDVPGVLARLDELVRQVDELPVANAPPRQLGSDTDPHAEPPAPPAWWQRGRDAVLAELRGLVRVSRIEDPEAVLLAPEQAFFLRENLKLKLLNARLSLLARQNDAARADVVAAAAALRKYFDPSSRRTQAAAAQLQQVQAQVGSAELPRVDETLAALATAAAGK